MSQSGDAFVGVYDADGREIDRIAAEHVPMEYPADAWRADPATGLAPDGRLFAAASGRLYSSGDGGLSWEWRPISFDGMESVGGFGVLPDGTLLLLYGTPRQENSVRDFAVARSTDGGASWEPGKPFDISPYTGSPGSDGNKICVLPDGTAIVAACLRNGNGIVDHDGTELPLDQQGIHDYVYRSADGGKTWGDRTLLARDSAESNFLSLGGNRVLAAIRRQRISGSNDKPQSWQQDVGGEPISKVLFLADSDDGGRTWTDVRMWTEVRGDCPGEFARLSDGRIMLLHAHRYPYPSANLGARVSRDEGKTWSDERYVVSEGCGYSGTMVLDDDTIVTVCGNAQLRPNGTNAEPWKMHTVRFKLPG